MLLVISAVLYYVLGRIILIFDHRDEQGVKTICKYFVCTGTLYIVIDFIATQPIANSMIAFILYDVKNAASLLITAIPQLLILACLRKML